MGWCRIDIVSFVYLQFLCFLCFLFMVCQALGLRLIIGAQTIMVPNVYDPSELRSDVNGKVVRYLHEEGTEIAKGDTFVAPRAGA